MLTLETTSNLDLPLIEDWFARDSRRIAFVVEEGGEPRDISDDQIEWGLYERSYGFGPKTAIVDTDDDGVELSRIDDASGEFQVRVRQDVLADVCGAIWQHIVIYGALGTRQSWSGEIWIEA